MRKSTIHLLGTPLVRAAALSLAVPVLLLAGAFASEAFGLVPCEMCWWQRWAHMAALPFAVAAVALCIRDGRRGDVARPRPVAGLVLAAAVCIAASGIIGVDHAGIEYHWWAGHTACTSPLPTGLSTEDFLKELMRQPIVRCDAAQWTLMGVSLAGWNAIASLGATFMIIRLTATDRRTR